jgi:hypothetical protein
LLRLILIAAAATALAYLIFSPIPPTRSGMAVAGRRIDLAVRVAVFVLVTFLAVLVVGWVGGLLFPGLLGGT